jgi:hypothetical protein
LRPRPLVALLGLAGALAGGLQLRSYDLFWHLATGQHIVAEGAVPRADPFSFTSPGAGWVDHSWLFQTVLWGAWQAAGAWGPWLLKVLCAATLALLMARHLRRWQVPPAATAALVLVALQGMRFRLTFRPELATLLLMAVAATLLCPTPGRRGPWRPLWLLPLAALWINLHGGALLAPMMVAACLAGGLAFHAMGRQGAGPVPWQGLWWALPLSAAALLVNPYGAEVFAVPFRLTEIVGQPWAANPEWMWPSPGRFPLLYLAVAALVAAGVRWRHRLEPCAYALGLLGAVLALRYVRNVGVFFVCLPFAMAPLLSASAGWARVRPRVVQALVAAGLLWIGWAPAWLALGPRAGSLGPGLEAGRYPVEACGFLERERVEGRIFNEVAFGGYLVWRFPDRPVFIDGRNEIYPELLQEIHGGIENLERFWEMTRRWDLDIALLRYPAAGTVVRYPQDDGGTRSVLRSWSEVYFPRRDWALVYWDDNAMIRVRRHRADPEWLARHEFRYVNPDDATFLSQEIRAGRVDPRKALAEVERRLQEAPGCRRAIGLQDEILQLVAESAHPARR